MRPTGQPLVSFVLATHNRKSAVTETVERIQTCGLPRGRYQIVVVDNASTDGAAELLRAQPCTLLALDHNAGSCAKALGMGSVTGEYTVFLDDDSHPRPGSIGRMIEHFVADPKLGAAGFQVHLPGGGMESAALPGVFVGCGVGFRTAVLRGVGGLDRTFFMQAEEYDLSFRLASAGWRVEVFDDLHVDHMKSAEARRPNRITYYDIRNNLRVVARYLPAPHHRIYRRDAIQRYTWIARRFGHQRALRRGLWAGRIAAGRERWTHRSHRLSAQLFERFFRIAEVEEHMRGLARTGVRSVGLASLGKNVWAFVRGARRAGLEITAIFDDRFCAEGRRYRGVPVQPIARVADPRFDALVVADMSPVHAEIARRAVRGVTTADVHDWYDCGTGFQPVACTGWKPVPHRKDQRRTLDATGTLASWTDS
jgi:GT2 family glycosyltransferase